jgi:hypothetical protein
MSTIWAPGAFGVFPKFKTDVVHGEVLFAMPAAFSQSHQITRHRALSYFLVGKGCTVPVQNLTTTTMGNVSNTKATQSFAHQLYENNSTAMMMRTCKQDVKEAIGAVL